MLAFYFRQLLVRWSNTSLPADFLDWNISTHPAWLCALVGFLCFVMLVPSCLFAQTEVEGEVSGEWNTEGSPYVFIEDALVTADEQLIINPGVQVIFTDENTLTVHGELRALGEEEDSVYFRQPNPGHSALIFGEDSSEESILSYCRMDSLRILVEASSPTFQNNFFFFSNIRLLNGSSSDIVDNTFDSPDGESPTAIYFSGGRDVQIISNELFRGGILMTWIGNCVIRNTQLHRSNINISNGNGLTIDNTSCFSLSISNGQDIRINDCLVENLLAISDIENLEIEGGDYPLSRFDHIRRSSINSCAIRSLSLLATEMIVNNLVAEHISISDWSLITLENSTISSSCFLNASNDIDIEFRNNVVDLLRVRCPDTIIENNTINRVETFENASRTTVLRNNRITERIICDRGSQPFFYQNDIGSWGNDAASNMVKIGGVGTCPLFVNNSFHEQENSRDGDWLVKLSGQGSEAEFYNNLFLGDDHGSKGIQVYNDDAIECDYNVFWGLDTVAVGFEIGEHSLVEDPRIMNRRTRDVHLLANSPLIDRGTTRWNRRDPDDTIPDIGCYPYDHRDDHSPFIDGKFEVETDPFSDFVYEASVVEDGDELEIWFENMPEWLEPVEERDEIVERIILTGRPPEEGEDQYEFTIWARDGADQRDSLIVNLGVSPHRLLWGEISGRLTRDESPYLVVGPLTVLEDERLIIEPGVEMKFRSTQIGDDQYMNNRLDVYGSIDLIGTEQDTIILNADTDAELENVDLMPWEGIFVHPGEDISSFSMQYCRIEDGLYGLYLSNIDSVTVTNCVFKNNRTGIGSRGSGIGIITHNLFTGNYGSSGVGSYDSLRLSHNVNMGFAQDDSVEALGHKGGGLGGTGWQVIISDNIILGSTGLSGGASEYGVIKNNLVINCPVGIYSHYSRNVDIYNNTLVNNGVGLGFSSFLDSIGADIVNNVIFQCDTIAVRNYFYLDSTTIDLNLSHNLFFDTPVLFVGLTPHDPPYGRIVDINANGDSCDAYQNLFLDPLFVNLEEEDFHVTEASPCIDAGIDVGLPFGGLTPDIGAFEFDQIDFVSNGILQPGNFALFQNFPNPFNHQTKIRFSLPQRSDTKMLIYDIQGRLQKELINNQLEAGQHEVIFNAESLASGVYFVYLATSYATSTSSMHFIK